MVGIATTPMSNSSNVKQKIGTDVHNNYYFLTTNMKIKAEFTDRN
jgi:hypothetical protein